MNRLAIFLHSILLEFLLKLPLGSKSYTRKGQNFDSNFHTFTTRNDMYKAPETICELLFLSVQIDEILICAHMNSFN